MILRPYQHDLVTDIHAAWNGGARNVMATLPTGGGKTVVFSHIIHHSNMPTCAIAHRKELVSQIALALAVNGVPHRIVGPKSLVKFVVNTQVRVLGTNFYNPNAPCAVAGVDTLIRRTSELGPWMQQVRQWVIDEGHHVLRGNKWGTATDLFPNARGLMVTATPCRADGMGLGRHADGVADAMVEGPNMRHLIEDGWLTDYRIFAPPSDIDLDNVPSASDGDFNKVKLKKAVRSSQIVGDVVEHYLRIAAGKRGITFATDVETAGDIAEQFRQAGVPAEVVTAKTPDHIRYEIFNRLERREILQIVNVDLLGEGVDCPCIEAVSMARPTQSYGLFCQQFGRMLRIIDSIPDKVAILIDHVGNVVRHGLPDKAMIWSLDARAKRPNPVNPDDDIPLRYCPECTQPYERILVRCPYCHHKPVPASRSKPEFVDGDLYELDPEALAEMRGAVRKVDNPDDTIRAMQKAHMPEAAISGFRKNSRRRSEMQEALRESMGWWTHIQKQQGRSDSEGYRLFYHTFGIDVLSAQALGRPEAIELANKVNDYIGAR